MWSSFKQLFCTINHQMRSCYADKKETELMNRIKKRKHHIENILLYLFNGSEIILMDSFITVKTTKSVLHIEPGTQSHCHDIGQGHLL